MLARVLPSLTVAALVGILSPAQSVGAQQGRELTLDQAIGIALENNLGLRSARIDTQIQTAGVAVEEAEFGRNLNGGLYHRSDRSPSVSALENVQSTTSNSQSLAIGIDQKLSTGGRVALEFSNSRSSSNVAYRTIDPVYGSKLELSLRQPLFQGRGSVNRVGIERARNSLEGARIDLDGQVRDLKAQVGNDYWGMFFAGANLQVKKQLHAGARRVLETVRTQAEVGTGTRSKILAAEVSLARREEDIVIAEGALREAEDQLKASCGLDQDPAMWTTALVLADSPVVSTFEDDLHDGIENALAVDVDFQQALVLLTDLDLQIALARDRTRPAAELSGRVGLSGIGESHANDLQGLTEADGRNWGGGVSLSLPLGRNPDEAIYRQRQLEKQRRAVDLENLRLQTAQRVRNQHRQVRINQRRAEVAGTAVGLAAQHVHEQEARLALGMATVREVLDAQDDLAGARVSHLRAIVDCNNARIMWERLIGR